MTSITMSTRARGRGIDEDLLIGALQGASQRDFRAAPDFASDYVDDDVHDLLARLHDAGMGEAIAVDLTRPDFGILRHSRGARTRTRAGGQQPPPRLLPQAAGAPRRGHGVRAVIFAGPSLPPPARPSLEGVCWQPPARRGDLYRAALERPVAIGLVDGYFETVPGVWHKEILWALSEGIHVFGSSSVGALRAVELAAFGMRGEGRVFEDFRDGMLQDDEVALLHAPEELDYAPLTEAMVNMRATVARALREGAVDWQAADALLRAAKSLFYKERTWEVALAVAAADIGLPNDRLARLHSALARNEGAAVRCQRRVALGNSGSAGTQDHGNSIWAVAGGRGGNGWLYFCCKAAKHEAVVVAVPGAGWFGQFGQVLGDGSYRGDGAVGNQVR
jgi:hypothetical protein